MGLLFLPDEILVKIIKYLDTSAKVNISTTCLRLKNLLFETGVLTSFKLTHFYQFGTVGLRHKFFSEFSYCIRDLDVSGIEYIPRSALVTSLKKFKNLSTLNVGFTNLLMPDIVDILASGPKIKKLSCNFSWPASTNRVCHNVTENEMKLLKSSFSKLTCVSFVGQYSVLFCSDIVLEILSSASQLCELNLITHLHIGSEGISSVPIKSFNYQIRLSKFTMHIFHTKHSIYQYDELGEGSIKKLLDFSNSEFFIAKNRYYGPEFIFSPNLFDVFSQSIKSSRLTCCSDIMRERVTSNFFIAFWNRASMASVQNFANELKQDLMVKIPEDMCFSCVYDPEPHINSRSRSFTVSVNTLKVSKEPRASEEPLAKKIRTSRISSRLVDFDTFFSKDTVVENLTLVKSRCSCGTDVRVDAVNFGPTFYQFSNVKYMSLIELTWRHAEVFKTLFENCTKLETLNIDYNGLPSYNCQIVKHLRYSKSLKNLRIVDKNIDMNDLFEGLLLCPSLEILCVYDVSDNLAGALSNEAVTKLIRKCNNLHYIVICHDVTEAGRKRQVKAFKQARSKYRPLLNFSVYTQEGQIHVGVPYNPYEAVFWEHYDLLGTM